MEDLNLLYKTDKQHTQKTERFLTKHIATSHG